MAVTEQTPVNTYAANGVATVFSFTFRVLAQGDLVVTLTTAAGAESTASFGVDYSINGLGAATGGDVVMTTAPAVGVTVTLYRSSALARATDYQDNGDLLAETVNADFDRIWLALQELFSGGRGAPTSIRVPTGETVAALPRAAARASRLLAFDSLGQPMLIPGVDAGSAATLAMDLANGADSARGAALVAYNTLLPYAVGSVGAALRNMRWITDKTSTGAGVVLGVVSPAQRSLNAIAFNQHMTDLKAAGGGLLLAPACRLEYDGTLDAPGGPNGAGSVGFRGAGIKATHLYYYGSGVALDLCGADGNDRVICTWEGFHLNGDNAGAAAVAVKLGWNMRAMPLLRGVWLERFGHYGLHFANQQWNLSFEDVEIDQCGRLTSNSSGIYKDPSIDVGTFNGLTFRNVQVEGCGGSGSAAGGINMPTTTANRGLYFDNCIVEGNFGTDEIFISNTSDLQFSNLYIERLNIAGHAVAVELSGCSGGIRGGFITAEGASNQAAVQLKSGSSFDIAGADFGANWQTAALDVRGSSVRLGRNRGVTLALDASGQVSGAISPQFSAHLGGVNQAGVASGVFTKVAAGTEVFDATGAYDAAAFRWTPKTIGRYQIAACVTFTAGVSGTGMILAIYKNGSAHKSATVNASGTGPQGVDVSAIVDVTATTDYFELFVRQSSGVAQTISGQPDETYFTGALV